MREDKEFPAETSQLAVTGDPAEEAREASAMTGEERRKRMNYRMRHVYLLGQVRCYLMIEPKAGRNVSCRKEWRRGRRTGGRGQEDRRQELREKG